MIRSSSSNTNVYSHWGGGEILLLFLSVLSYVSTSISISCYTICHTFLPRHRNHHKNIILTGFIYPKEDFLVYFYTSLSLMLSCLFSPDGNGVCAYINLIRLLVTQGTFFSVANRQFKRIHAKKSRFSLLKYFPIILHLFFSLFLYLSSSL